MGVKAAVPAVIAGVASFSLQLFVLCLWPFAPILYAQEVQKADGLLEVDEEEDKEIELQTVTFKLLDTTHVDIPREKFRSYSKPDLNLYVPLKSKERPWYLPPTSIPEKIREGPVGSERDFLFSLTAYSGFPLILGYQMLVVREFSNYEALLDLEGATLRGERTGNLIADPEKKLGVHTIDKRRGAFAYQSEMTNLRADVKYAARDLAYLDMAGDTLKNDRSLIGLYAGWEQRLPDGLQSSLNLDLSNLGLEETSSGSHGGWKLKTDFGIDFPWPRANPMEASLSVLYFAGENQEKEFKETVLRSLMRDRNIRIWYLILEAGAELMLDARSSSAVNNGDWQLNPYLNPHLLLMSYIGTETVLKASVERCILGQDLENLYIGNNYIRFNPDLELERTWDLAASMQTRLGPGFTVEVAAFDKEIRELTIFKKSSSEFLAWEPESRGSARIIGASVKSDLSFLDNRLKFTGEYIHESHDDKIPYRPTNTGSLTAQYVELHGLDLSLSVEYYGTRYVDVGTEDDSLSDYFLWKPRISKSFGKYASAFALAEIYTGKDDYQVWEGYELPAYTVDFGLTLKF